MFDYKEGNLSAAEAEEFENFLIQHPEYEVDADAWDMAYVQSEPVIYPHAEKLEKKRRGLVLKSAKRCQSTFC